MSNWQTITSQIIDLIERENCLPWCRPWHVQTPLNAISRKPYKGINRLSLSSRSWSDPRWVTFKQAQGLGGSVKRGEKGQAIVWWQAAESRESNDKSERIEQHRRFKRFCHVVFNVGQCENLDLPSLEPNDQSTDAIAAVDRLLSNFQDHPTIIHGGDRACYSPGLDLVKMPEARCFESPEAYALCMFHELAHSSGHPTRLNRKSISDPIESGSETYGFEELLAQLSASFLCSDMGIDACVNQSAAYINNWLQALRNDKTMIIRASNAAQRASDYMQGKLSMGVQIENSDLSETSVCETQQV